MGTLGKGTLGRLLVIVLPESKKKKRKKKVTEDRKVKRKIRNGRDKEEK